MYRNIYPMFMSIPSSVVVANSDPNRKHQVLQQDELLACISRYEVANSGAISALHKDILQVLQVQQTQLAHMKDSSSTATDKQQEILAALQGIEKAVVDATARLDQKVI